MVGTKFVCFFAKFVWKQASKKSIFRDTSLGSITCTPKTHETVLNSVHVCQIKI